MLIVIKIDLRFLWTVLKLFVKRKPLTIPLPFALVSGADDKPAGPVVH